MLTKQYFDQSNWQDLIATSENKSFAAYFDLFSAAAKAAEVTGNAENLEVFQLLARITSFWFDLSDRNNPFRPLITYRDGSQTFSVDDLDVEAVNVLEELVVSISDPEMQARVADILWIKKRNPKWAIMAASAYIASDKNLNANEDIMILERTERAIQIAIQLKNRTLFDSVFGEVITLLKGFETDEKLLSYQPIHFIGFIQKYKNKDDEYPDFVLLSERGAQVAKAAKKWDLAQLYWETHAGWYRKDAAEYRDSLIAAAEIDVIRAQEASNEVPPNNLAAHTFIQDAIERMRAIGGLRERIDQLQILMQQYGMQSLSEMHHISVGADVTKIVLRATEKVKGKNLKDALVALASLEYSESLSSLRKEAEATAQRNIFTFLTQSNILDDQGNVVARGTPLPEDHDQAILNEMYSIATRYQDLRGSASIRPAIEQIVSEHSITLSVFKKLLKDHPFIATDQEEICARGLYYGFAGDFLLATHLLIPQIENMIRQILQRKGVITAGLDKNMIQDQFTLQKIIYDENLEAELGEDIVFDLKGLLVERFGSNLRNLSAHGLMSTNDFYSARCIYFWWLIFRLWCLPRFDLMNE